MIDGIRQFIRWLKRGGRKRRAIGMPSGHVQCRCSLVAAPRPVDIADRSTHEWEPRFDEYIVHTSGDRCGDCGGGFDIGEIVYGLADGTDDAICRLCYEVR